MGYFIAVVAPFPSSSSPLLLFCLLLFCSISVLFVLSPFSIAILYLFLHSFVSLSFFCISIVVSSPSIPSLLYPFCTSITSLSIHSAQHRFTFPMSLSIPSPHSNILQHHVHLSSSILSLPVNILHIPHLSLRQLILPMSLFINIPSFLPSFQHSFISPSSVYLPASFISPLHLFVGSPSASACARAWGGPGGRTRNLATAPGRSLRTAAGRCCIDSVVPSPVWGRDSCVVSQGSEGGHRLTYRT